MQKFSYQIYKPSYANMSEVIEQMQGLTVELQNTDLHNLIPFNTTYLIITQKVYEQIGKKYFDEDETMQTFDICFAKYYFDALHAYTSDNHCDPSWKILFDLCKKNSLLQTQYMALGVNAHVNNDLAFALQDTLKNRDQYSDYNKINDVISSAITEVFNSFHETKMLDIVKSIGLPIYHPLLVLIIKNWRGNAWKNYSALANGLKARDDIKKRALIIAKRLTLYG